MCKGSNHRPINRKSLNLRFQLRHQEPDDFRWPQSFFVRWFFFKFALPFGIHPTPRMSLFLPSKKSKKKKKKRWKKPRLRIFRVFHLEIANVHTGTNPPSTNRSFPADFSQDVAKRTWRVQKWRALTGVYHAPFWYLHSWSLLDMA